jgi:hypothetical protein
MPGPRVSWTIALHFVALSVSFGLLGACSDDDDGPTTGGVSGSGGAQAGTGSPGGSGKSNSGSAGAEGSDAGAPNSGGSSGSGTPASVTKFWSDFAGALCHRYWHCPRREDETDERTRLRAVAQSEARCVALVEELVLARPRTQALNSAVAAGQVRFQASEVQACLDVTSMCDYPPDVDPLTGAIRLEDVLACREVFDGNVAAGDGCDLSEQCSGPAVCVVEAGGDCAGVCTALLAEGATCTVDRECAAGAGAWPICLSTKCSERPIGTPGTVGQSCVVNSNYPVCADDSWCPTTVCAPAVALGDECDPDTLALSQCADGYCGGGDQCTAFVVQDTAQATCDDNGVPGSGTQLCDSFASLVCVDDACVETDRSAGSPCNDGYWFDAALCPPEPLLPAGEACSNGDGCQSGLCRGTCAATLCGT